MSLCEFSGGIIIDSHDHRALITWALLVRFRRIPSTREEYYHAKTLTFGLMYSMDQSEFVKRVEEYATRT